MSTEKSEKPRHYAEQKRGSPCFLKGKVVSTKMQKTIVVEVGRTVMHRKYKKYTRIHSKVYAHDEKGEAKLGDEVKVAECRPYSKLKRFRLLKVIRVATKAPALTGRDQEGQTT